MWFLVIIRVYPVVPRKPHGNKKSKEFQIQFTCDDVAWPCLGLSRSAFNHELIPVIIAPPPPPPPHTLLAFPKKSITIN